MKRILVQRLAFCAAVLASALSAHAEGNAVGKLTALNGTAARFADAAKKAPGELVADKGVALKVGDEVLLGDAIRLDSGNAKFTLNDNSVLMLGSETESDRQAGAFLAITEGDFKGQVRSKFSASLIWGKVWSHVTKALSGSEAKFEVTTPRAVAGVRGTIFRVDAVQFVTATQQKQKTTTRVRVTEGKVRVALADTGAKPGRHQVPGPHEVTKDQWEKGFVDLQKGYEVNIGEELEQPRKYDASKTDAFDDFVNKNQK